MNFFLISHSRPVFCKIMQLCASVLTFLTPPSLRTNMLLVTYKFDLWHIWSLKLSKLSLCCCTKIWRWLIMTTGEQLRKFSQFCLLKLVALDVHIIPRQSEVKNLFHAITCITWPVTSSSSNVSAFPLPRFLNYFFLTTLHSAGSTPSSGRSE